ncbi:MAG: glycosyltransferase [Moraxella sp.]|uniref:glycosyltransferase n=1 Tax=Moraxella sp. TaxID=479 RepID=UPI0026DD0E6C|nr:glycosyltransferase [Moraxella sp.]MDO4449382.1 glycosyltransferase [Moraxella sp.]
MKVMHLSSSLKHDEAERGIYAITHALAKAGHESVVIGSVMPDNELVLRLLRDDTIYYRLPMTKKSWWSLVYVLKLRQLIYEHRPDIIHVHSRTPAWVLHWALRPIAKDKRPKTVAMVYGFYALTSYDKALFYADVIISASRSIDRYLKEKLTLKKEEYAIDEFPFKVVCVRRGVDVRKYPYRHHVSVHWLHGVFAQYPELEHKKWLVFPTPIGHEYGQDWLIDILGNLQEKFPNIHAIIMDDEQSNNADVAHEEFVQRLHALNLQNKTTFIGRRPPDMREWLAAANVVLALAEHPESIGITAIQAIHLGTPVVGWARGAFADILSITYPQGLVKEETAIALCKNIKFHLQNKTRPAMTHEYTIDQMTAETLAVYQSLIPDCKLVEKDKKDNLVCIKTS